MLLQWKRSPGSKEATTHAAKQLASQEINKDVLVNLKCLLQRKSFETPTVRWVPELAAGTLALAVGVTGEIKALSKHRFFCSGVRTVSHDKLM